MAERNPAVANAKSVANGVANSAGVMMAVAKATMRRERVEMNALKPADVRVDEGGVKILKPRRGDREKYNARQREYMRRIRAQKKSETA